MKEYCKFYLVLLLLFVGCVSTKKAFEYLPNQQMTTRNQHYNLKNWHLNDIIIDTLPGISLNRAYDSLLVNKKAKETIVAIIDSEIDLTHTALKNHIWINKGEILNNGIDDDNNGYIDDVNGWNFLGNSDGENNKYINFESSRILREYKMLFKDKDTFNLTNQEKLQLKEFKRIQKSHDKLYLSYYEGKKTNDYYDSIFPYMQKEMKKIFKGNEFTDKDLDSLIKTGDHSYNQKDIELYIKFFKYKVEYHQIKTAKDHSDNIINILLNENYDDRKTQGDDQFDLNDLSYGSILGTTEDVLQHGTKMAGIVSQINDEIKLMSLAVSAYGDEHDKDIALAIRYAVDNGAQVINMSFYKEYSLRKEWVLEAIKYAEDENVLVVSIAGNDGLNLNEVDKFPNDRLTDGSEVADNFMLVGASNYKVDKFIKLDYSSYGSIDVDIFAPGTDIHTTLPKNKYTEDSNGTSSAGAITSGVAALMRSYYPDLTASQVKHILMDSGIEYTLEVSTPTEEDPDKTTPFNQLSKSGKVLNAYNALIMAERISKGK
jgi:cell wall-associated protease